jgi:hypothetical protein
MSLITIKQFFENQITNKQAHPELVRYKKYQLSVRNSCLRICKSRNIKVDKSSLTKTKSVYLFEESIIQEVVAKEIQIGKPRGKHSVKPKSKLKRKSENQ